jgi:16S rRNA (guanine527-N7)-methyltransferase
MDSERLAALLGTFLAAPDLGADRQRSSPQQVRLGEDRGLAETQLKQFSSYLDLLLQWNARINLTSVREPEAIVTRHFGESLFAARQLFPSGQIAGGERESSTESGSIHPRVIDFGSGAGFPGLPIKIWAPRIELSLIESNQKKATFLREVIRKLSLGSANVFSGRAEDFRGQAEFVTLRAVERFEKSLPTAARLVAPGGRLALLIGQAQSAQARRLEPKILWQDPLPIPLSLNRVLLIGIKREGNQFD